MARADGKSIPTGLVTEPRRTLHSVEAGSFFWRHRFLAPPRVPTHHARYCTACIQRDRQWSIAATLNAAAIGRRRIFTSGDIPYRMRRRTPGVDFAGPIGRQRSGDESRFLPDDRGARRGAISHGDPRNCGFAVAPAFASRRSVGASLVTIS